MARRSYLQTLIALILVVSMLPGMSEVVITVGHLLVEGHAPHSALHVSHDAQVAHDESEHGCTPTSHHCACHQTIPAVLTAAAHEPAPVAVILEERRPQRRTTYPSSRAHAPPTRPPIA